MKLHGPKGHPLPAYTRRRHRERQEIEQLQRGRQLHPETKPYHETIAFKNTNTSQGSSVPASEPPTGNLGQHEPSPDASGSTQTPVPRPDYTPFAQEQLTYGMNRSYADSGYG